MTERNLFSLPVTFVMHDQLRAADVGTAGLPAAIGDITKNVARTWHSFTRGRGGWWRASCDWSGEAWEMEELFIDGLQREIRMLHGGQILFQGFIGFMKLTQPGGDVFTRDWEQISNRSKAIYTRIGDNQFTNGSVESGAWPSYGSPATNEQSTTWKTDGTYSDHIIVDSDEIVNGDVESATGFGTTNWINYNTPTTKARSTTWSWDGDYSCHIVADQAQDGAIVYQTGMTATAGTIAHAWARVNIISGTWEMEIYRIDTGDELGSVAESTLATNLTIKATVAESVGYTGNVGVRIKCTTATGEIYADGVEYWSESADGATIQADIEIVSDKAYILRCSVDTIAITGSWVLQMYRTDTGEELASASEVNTGERVLSATLAETNTYAGEIGVRLYCTGSGEIYADSAAFQESPYRAETSWHIDQNSADEHGLREAVLLLPGSSDDAANAKAATLLAARSWPHSLPPRKYEHRERVDETKLELEIYGYVWTMNNTHSGTTGTDDMSSHVTALVLAAEYLDAGIIESNTSNYYIDNRAPLRLWDIAEDITISGDVSGDRWACGVYADRKFDYTETTPEAEFNWRGGVLRGRDGSPIEPWLAEPGFIRLDEMPLGPEQISGVETDDPRILYMFEVEFDCEAWLDGEAGIRWFLDEDSQDE